MSEEKTFDFEEVLKKARKEMGHVNIAIMGKTGVGKSTLINAIFHENLAKTGVGKPLTQNFTMYSKEGQFYSLLDSKGFELADYKKILEDLKQEISRRKTSDASQHIHVAWFCINDNSDRIEDAEIEFINELAKDIPVIIVLTKCFRPNYKELYNNVIRIAKEVKQVVRVLALYDGEHQPFGLEDLVEATNEVLPDAIKNAFAAAQQIDLELKKKSARKAIAAAVTAGIAACAIPLPFADSAALAPIEIGMLASISNIMGLETSRAFLSTLVSSAIGVTVVTVTGRAIVTGLLKLIPGLGTLAGGMIGAAVATAMITAMGEAYIAAVIRMQASGNTNPEDLSKAFIEEMKKQKV